MWIGLLYYIMEIVFLHPELVLLRLSHMFSHVEPGTRRRKTLGFLISPNNFRNLIFEHTNFEPQSAEPRSILGEPF